MRICIVSTLGHHTYAQMLIAHRAAVDLVLVDAEDGPCFSALMFAAENGHDACARALLEAGARQDLETSEGSTALSLARSKGHAALCALLEG